MWHRRHHDDEIIDKIEVTCVPRYKTSGLSGDEWRTSYLLVISRKGTVLYERSYSRLRHLVAHLPWVLLTLFEMPEGDFKMKAWNKRIDDDAVTCTQNGCAEPAVHFFKLKEVFAPDGMGPLPEGSLAYAVCFCEKHKKRGDCGREDSDSNMVAITREEALAR